MFPTMRQQIDRDARAYREKCEKNRRNGALGGKSERCPSPPKEKEKEKTKTKEKEEEGFCPPSLCQVQAYCHGRNSTVDAQRFVDFYTANGWRVGSNPMRDWKAALRTWERRTAPGDNPFLQEDL